MHEEGTILAAINDQVTAFTTVDCYTEELTFFVYAIQNDGVNTFIVEVAIGHEMPFNSDQLAYHEYYLGSCSADVIEATSRLVVVVCLRQNTILIYDRKSMSQI